jgi:hypothetical protein
MVIRFIRRRLVSGERGEGGRNPKISSAETHSAAAAKAGFFYAHNTGATALKIIKKVLDIIVFLWYF